MISKKNPKGLPMWVREIYGKYRWEYQLKGEYFAHGYYETANEAYESCLAHRSMKRSSKRLEQSINNLKDR